MEENKVVEVPAKFKGIVDAVEKLTLIETHELVKLLEEKLGVSASAAVAVAGRVAVAVARLVVAVDEAVAIVGVVAGVVAVPLGAGGWASGEGKCGDPAGCE